MWFLSRSARLPLVLAVLILLPVNALAWRAVLVSPPSRLEVTFLYIGQGDAILIEGPTGIDMIIDGGPDRSVLRQLPREIGLLDRSIDVMVGTHPDKDHIAGLVDVLGRYRVRTILTPGIERDSSDAVAFSEAAAQESDAVEIRARRGMRLHLGGGAFADILYPDRDVSNVETNNGSIIMRVTYGTTSFMFTGDAPMSVEDHLVSRSPDSSQLRSTVLKAGHHGSRTSTGERWLEVVDPAIVAISAGRDNQYGHPHTEVVEHIRASGAELLSTSELGTLRFVSDGKRVWLR